MRKEINRIEGMKRGIREEGGGEGEVGVGEEKRVSKGVILVS